MNFENFWKSFPEECKYDEDSREYVAAKEAWNAATHDYNEWKNAIIDTLVINCILQAHHADNPKDALADLIKWENQMALDPVISMAAQNLIERGEEAGAKRVKDKLYGVLETIIKGMEK